MDFTGPCCHATKGWKPRPLIRWAPWRALFSFIIDLLAQPASLILSRTPSYHPSMRCGVFSVACLGLLCSNFRRHSPSREFKNRLWEEQDISADTKNSSTSRFRERFYSNVVNRCLKASSDVDILMSDNVVS